MTIANPSDMLGEEMEIMRMATVPKPADHKMTFGLHRGKTLREIGDEKSGMDYLRWVISNDLIKDRVLRTAARDFLKSEGGG